MYASLRQSIANPGGKIKYLRKKNWFIKTLGYYKIIYKIFKNNFVTYSKFILQHIYISFSVKNLKLGKITFYHILVSVSLVYGATYSVRGVHPPWDHDAFPLFQISPLFSKNFKILWKISNILPFPEQISIFIRQNFWWPFFFSFFSHRPQIFNFPPILPLLVHFPPDC